MVIINIREHSASCGIRSVSSKDQSEALWCKAWQAVSCALTGLRSEEIQVQLLSCVISYYDRLGIRPSTTAIRDLPNEIFEDGSVCCYTWYLLGPARSA